MEIKHLSTQIEIGNTPKLEATYNQFDTLLLDLRKKEIPSQLIDRINTGINEINSFRGSGTDFGKFIKMKQSTIVTLLAKEVKIVSKNYYQTIWMSMGMAATYWSSDRGCYQKHGFIGSWLTHWTGFGGSCRS